MARAYQFTGDDVRMSPADNLGLRRVATALAIIRDYDARRYDRVQAYIRVIFLKDVYVAAYYHVDSMTCVLDLCPFKFDLSAYYYTAALASTLVHEATHGLIASKGIAYNRKSRMRIERICSAEERRFVSRIDPAIADWLLGEFDGSRWHPYYNPISNAWIAWKRKNQ